MEIKIDKIMGVAREKDVWDELRADWWRADEVYTVLQKINGGDASWN